MSAFVHVKCWLDGPLTAQGEMFQNCDCCHDRIDWLQSDKICCKIRLDAHKHKSPWILTWETGCLFTASPELCRGVRAAQRPGIRLEHKQTIPGLFYWTIVPRHAEVPEDRHDMSGQKGGGFDQVSSQHDTAEMSVVTQRVFYHLFQAQRRSAFSWNVWKVMHFIGNVSCEQKLKRESLLSLV